MHEHLQVLVEAGVAENVRPVVVGGEVIAWKASRMPALVKRDLVADDQPPPDWEVAWHGTNQKNLVSILQHNFQAAGAKAGGKDIRTVGGHIALGKQVFGIDDILRIEHGGGFTNCVAVGVLFLSKEYLDACAMSSDKLSNTLSKA